MRRTVPRRPWAHGALVAIAVLALIADGCRSRQEEEERAACLPRSRRPSAISRSWSAAAR